MRFRTSAITLAVLAAAAPAAQAVPRADDPPKVSVVINPTLSTPTELVLDISLPGKAYTRFLTVTAPNGKQRVKVVMPGLTTSFDPTKEARAGNGLPGIPAFSIPFAIPVAPGSKKKATRFANVTTEVPNAWFEDMTLGADAFPASTQALDGTEEPLTHVATTHGFVVCSAVGANGRILCWGHDFHAPNGTSMNSYNEWYLSPGEELAQRNIAKRGLWRTLAVGEGVSDGGQAHVCAVGDPDPSTKKGSTPRNRLECFGKVGNLKFEGLGTGAGETPTDDVRSIGASAPLSASGSGGAAVGSEFCMLRNFGSPAAAFSGRPGAGEIRCFGRGAGMDWQSPPMTDPASGSPTHYVQLSVGNDHACALVVSGLPRCWGDGWTTEAASIPNPLPTLEKVVAGDRVDCGIKATDHKLVCWGVGPTGEHALFTHPIPTSASGQVRDVSLGENSACVVNWDKRVVCFPFEVHAGNTVGTPLANIPDSVSKRDMARVELGGREGNQFACAISTDDKVSCWGVNLYGEASEPQAANAPKSWNDASFGDFIESKLYSGMSDELVRPYKEDENSYKETKPVPTGEVNGQGGEVGGDNNLFKAVPISTDGATKPKFRSVGLGQLQIYGAQYTASTRKLRIFNKVRVRIKFDGAKVGSDGKVDYGFTAEDSPYEDSFHRVLANVLVNGPDALTSIPPVVLQRESTPDNGRKNVAFTAASKEPSGAPPCGEEMLVVAAPEFADQAAEFARGKNSQGVLTRTVTVGDSAVGTSAQSIRTFVQGEFSKTDPATGADCIAPSYLTLLGNSDKVPAFYGDVTSPTTPSDFDYALPVLGTYVPDLAVGRLPAADSTEATTMVRKALSYETAAPSGLDAFYKNTTLTGFFQNPSPTGTQDQRGFIRTQEYLRASLVKSPTGYPAKTVERLYSTSNPAGNTHLRRDDLGRSLPLALQTTQRETPWRTGSQASLVKSVNAGRFLVVSRDHGSYDRILNPAYGSFTPSGSTSSVAQMKNGSKLPVAWLIACLAGRYDDPINPSMAEELIGQPGGGMAAVVAASRESPTEVNNSFLLAMADSVWPTVLPTGNKVSVYRMGDVLNAAKLQVLMSGGPNASVDISHEMRLYNLFGDPSMQMWTKRPVEASGSVLSSSLSTLEARVTFSDASANGASAVLIGSDGVPRGKALVVGNSVVIRPANGIAAIGPLSLVLSQDQRLPKTISLR